MSISKETAESLIRLSEHPDGRGFLRRLTEDFDQAMRVLLYAKPDDVFTAQGHARALHEQLKQFEDAKKVLRR